MDVLTNVAHKRLSCLANTSFMRAQPTFKPNREIESPLFYFKLLQMTTMNATRIDSASLFICFLFVFLLFFFWRADRWHGDGPPGELRFVAHSQTAPKLHKQAFSCPLVAATSSSLADLHVWQKEKEAAGLALFLFILFHCYFLKLFWHFSGRQKKVQTRVMRIIVS